MIAENCAPHFIQWTDSGLTVFSQNCHNFASGYLVVVKKVGTVAGHDDLGVLGCIPKTINKDGSGCRVKRRLWLLDPDEPSV